MERARRVTARGVVGADVTPQRTEADLLARARTLVERMGEVGRIVYATPCSIEPEAFAAAVGSSGLVLREREADGSVARWSDERDEDTVVVVERADLGVRIFEARGPDAHSRVRGILERVPFVPQSKLLREAYDVSSPDAPKALLVLAHSVVVWDEEWSDLFLLHLASPDPIVRHNAASATFLAAMVAGVRGPACELLREASRRERYPKLKETLEDAVARLG